MSSQTRVHLDSRIFNSAELKRALSNAVGRAAKDFKTDVRQRMIKASVSGIVYRKGRGRGFTRSHRASARGQSPAPDTLTLARAVTDSKTGDASARVEIANRINPENGQNAREYAEILQEKMDRPIMNSVEQLSGAKRNLTNRVNETIRSFL